MDYREAVVENITQLGSRISQVATLSSSPTNIKTEDFEKLHTLTSISSNLGALVSGVLGLGVNTLSINTEYKSSVWMSISNTSGDVLEWIVEGSLDGVTFFNLSTNDLTYTSEDNTTQGYTHTSIRGIKVVRVSKVSGTGYVDVIMSC